MQEIKDVCINFEDDIKLNLMADESFKEHAAEIKAAIESFTAENPIHFENYGFGFYKLQFGDKSYQPRDIVTVHLIFDLCGIDKTLFQSDRKQPDQKNEEETKQQFNP